ncbi:hypothetical protein BH10ACT3_BH10ACT3_08140 [soil metagenome]
MVLNWNSAWFTRRCLRALLDTEYPSDHLEIVVVDNASVDGSLEQIRASFPQVRVVANDANLGFAEGCNRAMRDLEGVDFVALINNDAVPEPGWLQPLVDALVDDPGAGAAAVQLVLEPAFTRLDLELSGGTALIESVRVGEVEVLDRALMDGIRSVGRIDWPMTLDHHLDDTAQLLLPAADGARRVTLTVTGSGSIAARTAVDHVEVELAGGRQRIELAGGEDREERLNGLGTDLSADSEGRDRFYGEPRSVLAGVGVDVVPGFCGGGVLLRSAMLDDVGLFDPSFFAYYEDTDLSWRARRAGWYTLGVPQSVVRHAFGGSAGNKASGFFFLNYRNWAATVLRNATRAERRVAVRSAWDRMKWAVRANILSAAKHGRRPDLTLVSAWARVTLAAALAVPRLRRSEHIGRVGAHATDDVRSRLQPPPAPRPPAARPGGPLVVYLDVTGSDEVATRIARDLADAEPRIDLVALIEYGSSTGYRRATPAEWAELVDVDDPTLEVDPSGLALEVFSPGSVLATVGPARDLHARRLGDPGVTRPEPQVLEVNPSALQLLGSALVEVFGTP